MLVKAHCDVASVLHSAMKRSFNESARERNATQIQSSNTVRKTDTHFSERQTF